MSEVLTLLEPMLSETAQTWLRSARERTQNEGPTSLPELFPQLPRRIGRELIGGRHLRRGDAEVDFAAWRACDAAALALLERPTAPDGVEVDLFMHGDLEERTMVMRCLGLLPVTDSTVGLLGEAQRTNTVTHFEAAVCDSNLAARARSHSGFDEADFNRVLLKVAFLELPLDRLLGATEHANPELSRMLQGLATEREAAGRLVWPDTNRMIAHAPVEGTTARLVGHLEHGDDRHRLAAAEGLAILNRPELAAFVRERLEREPRPGIRSALERALAVLEP